MAHPAAASPELDQTVHVGRQDLAPPQSHFERARERESDSARASERVREGGREGERERERETLRWMTSLGKLRIVSQRRMSVVMARPSRPLLGSRYETVTTVTGQRRLPCGAIKDDREAEVNSIRKASNCDKDD